MPLEEQLSLTRNGGVYYEGQRVKPTPDPVLFIGLGGTGADALVRIKNEVQQRMPLPQDPSGRVIGTSPRNIAFLSIDTDQTSKTKSYGVASFNADGSELLEITVDNLPGVVQHMLEHDHDSPIWSWYDPEVSPAGGMLGANGVRQIGRFMLIRNMSRVTAAVNTVLGQINRAASENPEGKQNLLVFIVAGIAGGTGSGTFLDVAYMMRKLASGNNMFRNVQIHGFIITPDVNLQNGGDALALQRNGFAALKELDYWMSVAEHKKRFYQEYPGNFRIDTDAAPFDFCHIITAQDQHQNLLTYNKILESVAGMMFSYIVFDQQRDAQGNGLLKQTYDNVAQYEQIMPKAHPANYRIESVGYMKEMIPYTEIMTLLSSRVFDRLSPMFNREPNQTQFNAALITTQLDPDTLWGNIHDGLSQVPIVGKSYGYGDIWPDSKPFKQCQGWLGDAQVVMRRTGSNLPAAKERLFVDAMDQIMRDKTLGPCYAARLLNSHSNYSLIPSMRGFLRDCREFEGTCANKVAQLKSEMENAHANGANISFLNPIGRSRAVETYMNALTEWINNEYALWAYHELGDAVAVFLQRLELYDNKIFHPLLGTLMELPPIFSGNLAKVNSDALQHQQDPTYHANYLIDPLEFETKYQHDLDKCVEQAASNFAETLTQNLKRWVGITLNEIDSTIADEPDVSGAISKFMTDVFSTSITYSVEDILNLLKPVGTNSNAHFETFLRKVLSDAVPMFHLSPLYANQQAHSFGLLSVPVNCTNLLRIATTTIATNPNPDNPNEKLGVLPSSELRGVQVVKVIAGMQLHAFSRMRDMEQAYETAMCSDEQTRAGTHLHREWREQLPSPIPESSWSDAESGYPEKQFTKKHNEKVRAAFKTCQDNNILVPLERGGGYKLLVGDASLLDRMQIHGGYNQRLQAMRNLFGQIWDPQSGNNIVLSPHGGPDSWTLLDQVRENALRFYPQCDALLAQAELLDRYNAKLLSLTDVACYAQALFANLIYDQGFSRMLRLAADDPLPTALVDYALIANSQTPDYDVYTAFQAVLTQEKRNSIGDIYREALTSLLDPQSPTGYNATKHAEKVALLKKIKADAQQQLSNVSATIANTRPDMREPYQKIADFLKALIEQAEYIGNGIRATI